MELLKNKTSIDFMGVRKAAIAISLLLIVASIVSLLTRGLNFGIDFTGGTLIEVIYPESVQLADMREVLSKNGFADAQVQHFGTTRDVMIRLAPREGENTAQISERVLLVLRSQTAGVEIRRVEFVGPQVGEELTEQGSLAMLFALGGILIYVALRFEWRFSLGAVAALIHDVIITLGLFSIAQFNFDLTVLAALLAIIGYSLNDTIVVFDRIRENFRKLRKTEPIDVMNISLNETLARTLMTGITTLLVLLALFYYGGEVLHLFSLALIFGILIGTYSSVYVASPMALMLGVSKQDLMPVKKEGAVADGQP